MNSRRATCCFSLLLAALFSAGLHAAPTADSASKPITVDKPYQNLIDQLADPDPALRQQAADALTKVGSRARSALLEAVASGDPQIAPRASDVLLSIPWYESTDPIVVKQLLQDYGKHETGDRARVAEMLAQFPAHISAPALVRLVQQDPSPTVRWMIMRTISQHMFDEEMARALREVDVSHAGAPLLAAAARAWLSVDSNKAMSLLQRAVALEEHQPSFDSGALDFAFDLLVSSAKAKKHLDQAAQLLRLQAKRERQLGDDDPSAVYELFALHAQYGPINGLSDDLRQFEAYLGRPQILYCLSMIEGRLGHVLTSIALERCAFASSVTSQRARWNAAIFLGSHDWTSLAQRELFAVLQGDGDSKLSYDLLARMRLSTILGDNDGDDNAAAAQLRAAVEELRDSARSQPMVNELVAQVQWREFRAARTARDEETMKKKVEALVTLSPSESSIALDLVPYLKERGRTDDAAAMFGRAYETANSKLAVDPMNPEQMNEVAWLCARCDEKVDVAVKLAMQAVSLAPESYAILDTAAEANYHNGDAKKAVELETRALELKPDDKFMLEQIAKFRKGLRH
jgi:tetratricopeptide (TPR) repeat protein